jgi:hypothetical protein
MHITSWFVNWGRKGEIDKPVPDNVEALIPDFLPVAFGKLWYVP